jgi:hypothetical protein
MTAKPFDLAAMQAVCEAAGEFVRQEAITSGQTLPVWDDVRGVIEIDPLTGLETPSLLNMLHRDGETLGASDPIATFISGKIFQGFPKLGEVGIYGFGHPNAGVTYQLKYDFLQMGKTTKKPDHVVAHSEKNSDSKDDSK